MTYMENVESFQEAERPVTAGNLVSFPASCGESSLRAAIMAGEDTSAHLAEKTTALTKRLFYYRANKCSNKDERRLKMRRWREIDRVPASPSGSISRQARLLWTDPLSVRDPCCPEHSFEDRRRRGLYKERPEGTMDHLGMALMIDMKQCGCLHPILCTVPHSNGTALQLFCAFG